MALGKGSGIFNLQFGGEFKKHRTRSNIEELRAQTELGNWYDKAESYQKPWQDYGTNALSKFQDWEKNPDSITSDPSYKWRVSQGLEGVENSAAAAGGLLSGNTLKSISDYGQKEASAEYNNEFNRWLQKLGIGSQASSNLSNLSSSRGNALSSLIANSASNMWKRGMEQVEATRQGEQATNSIVQSWIPASGGKTKSK